jgi:hypothetical protein
MKNQFQTTLLAGVAGTIAMMAARKALRSTVMSNRTQLMGPLAATLRSQDSQRVGTRGQFASGTLLAHAYVVTFRSMGLCRRWTSGLALGLVHGALAGLGSAVYPRESEEMPEPAAFMLNRGAADAVVFVALHGLFGAVVGAVIERRHHMT